MTNRSGRRSSRWTRKQFAGRSLGALCLLLSPEIVRAEPAASVSGDDTRLWFPRPAEKWTDAMPLGNGRMGAMVFGGTAEERIQFNEDTLWTGQPHDYVRPGARQHLEEIRGLLDAGRPDEAATVIRAGFLSDPVRQKAYQSFGDLHLHFPGHESATDYHRELDLSDAIARVTYRVGDVTYRREAFASYPNQAIVVRLTADRPGRVGFTLTTDSPHSGARTDAIGPDTLRLTGQVEEGGLRFESRVRVLPTGGRITPAAGGGLTVTGADAITLLLTAATSFRSFTDIGGDPAARCDAALKHLGGKDFRALRAAHLKDYQRLFRQARLDLGSAARAALPTDERIQQVKTAGLEGDPALAALYFHFGRYLLIASSRPGGQPANLQGLWNDQLAPPWESKWTTNINVEMNYWPAELTGLSECHEPLFALIDDLAVSGRRTAKEQYGCRGWVLHHNTDLWRGTAPINNIDGVWPTGGAWLCHHLWEHYLFTGDRDFLAHRAYPAMREAALFFVDFLVRDAKTGWLVTSPSYSPEQGTLTRGPAMDSQLIRALMTHTLTAARLLGADRSSDAGLVAEIASVHRRLAPDQIGKYGQLQEWLDDIDVPNNNHRHMSPLWALYPGADISPAIPKLFDAAKVLLKWRGDGSTGWSYAWRIPLWARVGDGETAYRQLTGLLQHKTLPSLLDLCGPFQIDGNFGGTAGITEMLLQSYQVTATPAPDTRLLDLLPALPRDWPKGSVTGLRARGGFAVDVAWDKGALTRAVVRSALGNPCVVRYGGRTVELPTERGKSYAFDGTLRRGA